MEEKTTDMLALVIGLLCFIPSDGVCCQVLVHILSEDLVLPTGESLNLSCKFTCLSAGHIAQLWRDYGSKNEKCLVNMTSTQPNVTLDLNINPATEAHAGNYSCMTQPPDTLSPPVSIWIEDIVIKKATTMTTSSEACRPPGQLRRPGLRGQTWYWMLLGKTAILLLTLASLAVKYKRG